MIAPPTKARLIAPRQVGGRSTFLVFVVRCDRARAFASWRLRGRAVRRVSIRPPWVPRCFRRRRFFVWAMGMSLIGKLIEARLDDMPVGVEATQWHLGRELVQRRPRD